MNEKDGLICSYLFDREGKAHETGWEEIRDWKPDQGWIWIHLDRKSENTNHWLTDESGLPALVSEALLAEETRPRSFTVDEGLIVILRGVNLNPGSDPEDMISIRIWIEGNRVITLRHKPMMAIQDIRDNIASGIKTKEPSDLLVQICARLIDRMGPVLETLDEQADDLEEQVVEAQSYELRTKLGALRRQAIALRRYIAPQRDVMARLHAERIPWLDDLHKAQLREVGDRLMRYVEDLDSARERAAVTQEELAGRLSEQMNKTMYILSIVAGIFLPLGLLTGLLGINVGGIPGTENHWAFTIVCLLLLAMAGVGIFIFRRFKFF
ncbi:MAG: zinc transporter ZntB [Planctomycetota bacterium]